MAGRDAFRPSGRSRAYLRSKSASAFPVLLSSTTRFGIETDTEIAITPAPIASDDDPMARMMLSVIGDWTKQLVAGAPVEYIGNREYQEGMQVRRWDFASWARLGRPIVREYQSPSVQAITLIIDTSVTADLGSATEQEDLESEFERLMSIAATAVMDITARRVHLQLRVTSGEIDAADPSSATAANDSCESMLVQLAAAEPIDAVQGESRLIEILENTRPQPILILSLVDLDSKYRARFDGSNAQLRQLRTAWQPSRQRDSENRVDGHFQHDVVARTCRDTL